jgi:DNA anti-recombination protein RmuC
MGNYRFTVAGAFTGIFNAQTRIVKFQIRKDESITHPRSNKMKVLKTIIPLIAVALFTAGLSSCEDSKKDNQFKEEVTQMEKQIKDELNELDKRIESLKEEAKEASEDTKDAINEQIEKLEDMRSTLSDKLSKLGNATQEQWEAFKKDVSNTMDEVKKALAMDNKKKSNS